MLANPENPPKIDWAAYKNKVPIPGMVDSFQKTYESMKIPYPQDTVSSKIDAQEQETVSIKPQLTVKIYLSSKTQLTELL